MPRRNRGGNDESKGAVTLGTRSDVGMKRSVNEDNFCALVGPNAPSGAEALLAVADGMGGHQAGEVASEMAIRGLVDRLSRPNAVTWIASSSVPLIQRTVGELNAVIHAAASRPETRGMGTTLTATVLAGNTLTIGHVGDSRAYLLRDGNLQQLTQDHSWVAEQVAMGKLSAREAEEDPRRNILTRALGAQPRVQVDGFRVEVAAGDILLICSDGLHSLVRDDEIARALSRNNPQSSSRKLVGLANDRGGNDNITVIVAQIEWVSTIDDNRGNIHQQPTLVGAVGGPSKKRDRLTKVARVLVFPGVGATLVGLIADTVPSSAGSVDKIG